MEPLQLLRYYYKENLIGPYGDIIILCDERYDTACKNILDEIG
jgi:hypothetical protein